MRRSMIWFALSAAWGLDCVVSWFRHNAVQAALTAFFALCFLATGLVFRNGERKRSRPKTFS